MAGLVGACWKCHIQHDACLVKWCFHCRVLIFPLLFWPGWSVAAHASHHNRRTRHGRVLILNRTGLTLNWMFLACPGMKISFIHLTQESDGQVLGWNEGRASLSSLPINKPYLISTWHRLSRAFLLLSTSYESFTSAKKGCTCLHKANVNTVGMEIYRRRFCNSQTKAWDRTAFLSSMLSARNGNEQKQLPSPTLHEWFTTSQR